MNDTGEIEQEHVIYPPELATEAFEYPALNRWERQCQAACLNGDCTSEGICECRGLYYGPTCDSLCNGEVIDRECFDLRTVYVGGLLIEETFTEYTDIMKLTVDLINNKTDGFFDETSRVHFEFMLNFTFCDTDTARAMLEC